MRLDLQTSALPSMGLELLRDVLDAVHELAAAGATRVSATGATPGAGELMRVVVTADTLTEPKVISVPEGQ